MPACAIIDIKHNSDVTRIASNIVTGVGFLGAGLIFRGHQSSVQGLTTAATVWAAAAIGMSAGIGNYFLAVETTAVTLGILVVLHRFEVWFEAMKETREYYIVYNCGPSEGLLNYNDFFSEKGFKLLKTKQEIADGKMAITWRVRGSRAHHDEVTARLIKHERIISLEY
jgi:putative Mg2+ transporter-C (MgtC) family protein